MLKKPVIQKFDKDLFKNSVVYNVKTLYRKTLEEATQQQIFQAVSYAIKDIIVDNWMNTQKEYQKEDPKTVYYLSMEFLMGRALGNNLINLQAYEDVEEALEELGIGRPSTYSPTISTIIDRGYVEKEKKQLVPTDLGFVVNKVMEDNFRNIVDVKFTADMESRLDSVEEGKERWQNLIEDFYPPFEESLEEAFKTVERIEIPDEVSDIPCDKCGAMMVYKTGRFGRFLACPNYPECKNTKPIVEKVGVKCPKCGGEIIKRKGKKGRAFYGCENYPECDYVSWYLPTGKPCPRCGRMTVWKMGPNGRYIVCSEKECGFVVPSGEIKNTYPDLADKAEARD